jgi:hypothetical protein
VLTRTHVHALKLVSCVFLSAVSTPSFACGNDLLELAREGNTSSLSAIRSFHCTVSVVEQTKGIEDAISGEYWREGDKARARYKKGGQLTDCLQADAKLIRLDRNEQSSRRIPPVADIHPAANGLLGNCDAWFLALASFTGPDAGTAVTFDELLSHPHKLHEVKRVTYGGKELVYVHVSHAISDLEFWFDPAANYMVRKHNVSATGQPTVIRSEIEVKDFREVAPSVFFPEVVASRTFAGATPLSTQTMTFRDIRVNQPIAAGVFSLTIPAGTTVVDQIQGKAYATERDGATAGRDIPLSRTPPPDLSHPPRTETKEEPKHWTAWIFPASVCFLGMGASLWLFRRWKSR